LKLKGIKNIFTSTGKMAKLRNNTGYILGTPMAIQNVQSVVRIQIHGGRGLQVDAQMRATGEK